MSEYFKIDLNSPEREFQRLEADIHSGIDRVLTSGQYINGKQVQLFEQEFASYLGTKHCVATSSGTDALQIALRACGIGIGDQVATVSLTTVATVAAIELVGAIPILIDVDPDYLTLDLNAFARLCNKEKIKAVVPVHLYGHPVDMQSLIEITSKYEIKVIEDCSQAHGAAIHGIKCGVWGDAAAFSFYPTKNLAALGDGGAVVTQNYSIATRAVQLREYGWHNNRVSEEPGINSWMDEIQAAILRVKLQHLDTHNELRRLIALRYDEAIVNAGLRSPSVLPEAISVYNQYVIRHQERDKLHEHLWRSGINTAIHYPEPIHIQPAYSGRIDIHETLSHTEQAWSEVLCLPCFPDLIESELEQVKATLKSFLVTNSMARITPATESTKRPIKIPVSRPSIGENELRNVKQVFDTAWLGLGATVKEFEAALSKLLGGRYVVGVASGTAALHLALAALDISTGDEVIVPSLTFCASVQVITALGAKPVFCEVDRSTLNINIDDVQRRITQHTRAIMPVHFCGNVCDMDALMNLAQQYGLRVIEDAAHAFGSSYHGQPVGSFGDITCFSFDPIKNITCGEGGAVVVESAELAKIIQNKRMLGMSSDRWQRSQDQHSWWYSVDSQGYRYHMSNINAAIGLAQLEKLSTFRDKKRRIVHRYNESFAKIPGIELLYWDIDQCCPFSYIILVKNGRRNDLHKYLSQQGIGSGVNYIPNHLQPYFSYYASKLEVTEAIYEEVLTLPLYSDMIDSDVERVIHNVTSYFEEN